MSKNMTRKGLAFGAGLALVASGVVALPAQASGIDNGWVRLAPSAGTSYSTLLGQKFDLVSGFATAADNGAKLKFLVEDADLLARYDFDGAISDFDAAQTPSLAAYAEFQGSTDSVVLAFAASTGIQDGDAVQGSSSFAVTGATAAVITELKTRKQVEAVKTIASTNLVTGSNVIVITDGGSNADTVVVTANAHGVVAGDIVRLASVDLTDNTVDGSNTEATIVAALNTYHVVSAADTNTFTFTVASGTAAATDTLQVGAGAFAVNNVRINLASTADVTANSPIRITGAAGTLDELTVGDELDSAIELTTAKFGLAGVSGAAAQKTDGTAGRNTDGSFIVDTTDTDDAGAEQTLRLAATKAGSVKVTAWIDSDADNVIDTTEYRSPQRTVTFVALANATFTTTIDTPLVGSSTQTAYVTIAPDINLAQFASGDVVVDFGKNGTQTDADQPAAFDSVLRVLKATATEATGAGDIMYAEAQFGTTNYGGRVFTTADTTTINIGGSNSNVDGAGVSTPYVLVGPNYNGTNVRSGTTSVQVVTDLTTFVASGTAPSAPAGVKAEVTITRSSLASTSTVAAGGKTLASTGASSISFFTTSNADGEVLVNLTATGAATDSVTVAVRVLDSDIASGGAGYTAAKSVTLTWAAATLAASNELIELATYGDANDDGTDDAQRSVAKGGSLTLNYQVRDSFGAPITTAGFRIAITSTAGSGGGSVAGFAAVTNGLATFTFTDNTVGATGSYTINADLQRINLAGTSFDQVDAGSDLDIVVNVGTAAAATITSPTDFVVGTSTAEALETVAVKTGIDARKTNYTFPYTSANGHRINGVVRSATGAGLPGQAVTIAAPAGVGLVTDDAGTAEVYATGSITVYTDSTGAYSVYAYSNRSGNQTFTITSGSATKTHVWQYAAPAVTSGTALALDMPASVSPGSTFKVTATLTDKFGNPVNTGSTASNDQISITYSGPGIVFGTLPDDTDRNGQVSFAVLLGANDKGTVSVTVAYDQSNDGDFTGTTALDKDITVTKTTSVGTGAAAGSGKVNVGSFNGRLVVYAANLNGKRISWKVGGRWGSAVADSNFDSFSRPTPRAGATVNVEVFVDGVSTLKKSVVTR